MSIHCVAKECDYCIDSTCTRKAEFAVNRDGLCLYYFLFFKVDYSNALLPDKYKDKRTEKEKILDEVIDFFELEEGYEKQEVINEITNKIITSENVNFVDDEDMYEFANLFYDSMIEKICNVLVSFKEDN